MVRYSRHAEHPPGSNVYRLRLALGWSQRTLAERCRPAIDHTTVRRLELNQGYTQDTLERIAVALGVSVQALFLPAELADWPTLPERVRQRLAEGVADASAAERYRRSS